MENSCFIDKESNYSKSIRLLKVDKNIDEYYKYYANEDNNNI